MGHHLIGGEFQSDKYPTTPRGKVPLSCKDPMAQDLLWEYAQRRRAVDSEFSDDLKTALLIAGFVPASLKAEDDDDDVETCETCAKKLREGDLGHRCADGPVLCEECAPTWADVLAQYNDEAGNDFGAFVDKTPEEAAEDRAAAQSRVGAGDGDKKHVWPL